MKLIVKTVAEYIALAAEAAAIAFIVLGAAQALITYFRRTFLEGRGHEGLVEARNELGHMLSLALEFLIGADILLTAITPTWQDIGQLAAIVGIRTVLNFFLIRELKEFGAAERNC